MSLSHSGLLKKKVIIIGAGFAGISAATSLAQKGYSVMVLEKNAGPGGRARTFTEKGFTYDMGPSWYWMPDIFEDYFRKFDRKPSDYYQLVRLDPSYTVFFGENDQMAVPAGLPALKMLFEKLEKGSGEKLGKFMQQAAHKYKVGMNKLVYKPGRSISEFLDPKLLADILRMDIFCSIRKHIRKFFRHPKIVQLMEFPILFLGAVPENTPALYSLMNYADMALGTWYPMGGMHKIVEGMVSLAEEQGVQFKYNQNVQEIALENGIAKGIKTPDAFFEADIIVAGADYQHVESTLLPAGSQSYSQDYWNKRVLAPSSLIFYLGVNKKLQNVTHHNLFFDEDFGPHAKEIYENPSWPQKPLFYVSVPSVTDCSVAPENCENLFILIPVAPGLTDTESIREKYYDLVMERLEKLTKQKIREHVVFKRSYAHNDFIQDYNAFKGNAYGLANTLMQTALLKPSLKSRKVQNLYYTGQFTVPGPGVPPSLISGQVVADEVAKEFK